MTDNIYTSTRVTGPSTSLGTTRMGPRRSDTPFEEAPHGWPDTGFQDLFGDFREDVIKQMSKEFSKTSQDDNAVKGSSGGQNANQVEKKNRDRLPKNYDWSNGNPYLNRLGASMSASHSKGGGKSSGGTVGVGVGATGGGGAVASGSMMVVVDTKGNVGVVESAGAGGMGGVGGSYGVVLQVTNAEDIYKLKGLSTQTGGSVGEGLTAGLEYIIGDGYSGVNFSFGPGGGLTPAELHSIAEYAEVQGRSVQDIVDFIKELAGNAQKVNDQSLDSNK